MELVLDEPKKDDIHSYAKTDILIDKNIKDYIGPLIIDVIKNIFGNKELTVRNSYGSC